MGKNGIPISLNHCLQALYKVFKAPDVENWRERKLLVLKLPRLLGTREGGRMVDQEVQSAW